MTNFCTNSSIFSADADSHHSHAVPCQQPQVPGLAHASGPDGQCLAVFCGTHQFSTTQSVPSKGVRACPECVSLQKPSSTLTHPLSDLSVQTCPAAMQGSDSTKTLQLLSKCQLSECPGQGSVSDSIVEEGNHLLESWQPS